MVNKKLFLLISVFIVAGMLFIYGLYLYSSGQTKTDTNSCLTFTIIKMYIDGEDPYKISSYCNESYSENMCKSFFYDFLLHDIKNNKSDAFDPNSPLNKIFFGYLQKYELNIELDDYMSIIEKIRLKEPLYDPNLSYVGVNAAITKNSSYCDFNSGKQKQICLDEVNWLKAKTLDECEKIVNRNVYLLCLRDISQKEYAIQLSKCDI